MLDKFKASWSVTVDATSPKEADMLAQEIFSKEPDFKIEKVTQ